MSFVLTGYQVEPKEEKMKNIILAGLIAATGTLLMFAPAQSAPVMKHSMYCRNNIYDPLCMDSNMFKMRTMMMSMTKEKVMTNRSKYCRNNLADPICDKKMMNNTMGF